MASKASTTTTFQSYLTLAEKALQKSRKSLDTRALIELAYGDDTAHIGGSDMLMGILDGVLDKIEKEKVIEELSSCGKDTIPIHCLDGDERKTSNDDQATVMRTTPQERLNKIDRAISCVIKWEEKRDQREGLDAKSARESLHQNLLPDGVTMEDVIAYREHEQRLQAKLSLQLELERIEGEISVLKKQTNDEENKIREKLGIVGKVERELEASADVCAMVTT